MFGGFRRSFSLRLLVLAAGLSSCSVQNAYKNPTVAEGTAECRNLAPGELQAVDHSLTTLPARYYLTRNGDVNGHRVYQAVVPVTFLASGACRTTPCQEDRSPYADSIFARTNSCLREASRYLKGPQGETLSVQLAPPTNGGMGPFQIELTPGLSRGDSQHWDTNWGCPEITHEVMHLLGLVDENHEMSLVEGSSYDCRAEGPKDSLMSDPQKAYNFSSPLVQTVECNCEGVADPECPATVAQLTQSGAKLEQCPANTHELVYGGTPEWIAARFAPETRIASTADRFRFTRQGTPQRPSLLYAAEFNAIVAPGCLSNRLYYACSVNAYRSMMDGPGCARDLPAECAGGLWISGR